MTPQYIELVKSTVPVLRENGVALTTYFYNRMLNNHPELKNTFNLDHQSTGVQPRALAAAVLAYAENIENPSVLAKAVERITTKHVSLNIQPDEYAIVGENLLHSISEVLDVPMESDLIAAWKAAYFQLADLLIGVEKSKYETISKQTGGWTGWRNFEISNIEQSSTGKIITLKPQNGLDIISAESGKFISVRVQVPNQAIKQPKQFSLESSTAENYQILVKSQENPTEFSVHQILSTAYKVGDIVEVSTPFQL